MKKVLIFGAAGVGLEAKKVLEKDGFEVVAFSDNDQWKWGNEVDGCPVLPPHKIKVEDYDWFAIGVYKYVDTIKRQLISMGVDMKRIIVPVHEPAIVPVSLFYNDKYTWCYPEAPKSIITIWGGIEGCAEGLQDLLRYQESSRIDFKNNFWAFQYFIEDCLVVEEPEFGKKFWEKYAITNYRQLCIDVYFIDDKSTIEKVRQEFGWNKEIVFFSDNYVLYQMVRNENTLKFWEQRLPRTLDPIFLSRIDKLKTKMAEYNIPLDEVCVVSGAVLEVYGLRDSREKDDIDIIMTDRFRKMYGSGMFSVSQEIEMHPQNELMVDENESVLKISDDEIILKEENHFWLRGVKFLDLELLYQQKNITARREEVLRLNYFHAGLT